MTFLLIITAVVYFIILWIVGNRFENIQELNVTKNIQPTIEFSIIIPFRNELNNLSRLFESLKKLNYPKDKIEIIFCDDHSTDEGLNWLKEQTNHTDFTLVFISNRENESGKKEALHNGILQAKFDYIITTDADCIAEPDWLLGFNETICNLNAELISGPVLYEDQMIKSTLSDYQITENAGLIAFTAVGFAAESPFMANGANLCFRKKSYFEVGGYEGNYNIPSGDDEFLLLKFNKHFPGKTHFIKCRSSMIRTPVQQGFSAFLNQRVRWASKAKKHVNKNIFILQTSILVIYLLMLLNFFSAPFSLSIIPICLKIFADIYFYTRVRGFFNLNFKYQVVAAISFLQLILVPVVGIAAFMGNYNWKERKYGI